MISIAGGTKTFSENSNPTKLESTGMSNLSATEKAKKFKGQDVGDVLNKIADPNWVNPKTIRKGVGNSEMGKEAFLKLLLAQLKNQDPTTPMESHEMAAQLAQFTSLEKLTNINTSIDQLAQTQNPSKNFDALALIGKVVKGDSSKINRAKLEDEHEISFDLMSDAEEVTVVIKNTNNDVVKELQLHHLSKGKNEISWNGLQEDGSKARPGDYKVDIVAKSNSGKKIHAETKFEGKITGVNYTPQGPVLMVGKKSVKMNDIREIKDPSLGMKKVESKNVIPAGAGAVRPKSKPSQGKSAQMAPATANGLDNIAMSRDLINKMKKTGIKTKAY